MTKKQHATLLMGWQNANKQRKDGTSKKRPKEIQHRETSNSSDIAIMRATREQETPLMALTIVRTTQVGLMMMTTTITAITAITTYTIILQTTKPAIQKVSHIRHRLIPCTPEILTPSETYMSDLQSSPGNAPASHITSPEMESREELSPENF
jgi:hypothetical protein